MRKYDFAVLAVVGFLVAFAAWAEDVDQTNTPKPQWIQNGLYLGKGSGGTSTPNATATSSNPLVIFGTSTLGGGCKIDSAGNLVSCQDAGFANNMTVSGTATITSETLGAAGGGAQFNDLSDANILGDAGVAGNMTVTGNSTFTSGSTFSSSAAVSGAFTASSALNRTAVALGFQGTRSGATMNISSGSICACSYTSECYAGTGGGSDAGVLLCTTSASTLTVTTPCADAGIAAICL